jgi:hypothetical protein
MKKGPEFLTEVSLGNAPPIEFVIKNLKIDEDLYRTPSSIEDVVQRTNKKYLA